MRSSVDPRLSIISSETSHKVAHILLIDPLLDVALRPSRVYGALILDVAAPHWAQGLTYRYDSALCVYFARSILTRVKKSVRHTKNVVVLLFFKSSFDTHDEKACLIQSALKSARFWTHGRRLEIWVSLFPAGLLLV